MQSRLHGLLVVLLISLYPIVSAANGELLSGPVVYSDQYVTIRATVLKFEEQTFHLGDVITLEIALEFDPNRVRIINLDETLLENSWRDLTGILHRGEPRVSQDNASDDLTSMVAFYDFQAVACPDGTTQCPGGKAYRLADIALGVELIDDDGRAIGNTDIMFRPSPGFVGLSSALALTNGRLESFNLYFPSRAFGLPVPAGTNLNPSLILFLIGLLMIGVTVVAPTVRVWIRHRVSSGARILGNRSEHVLDRLQDKSLDADEFNEGVRVAVTWHCYDEFKINPVHWPVDDRVHSGDEALTQLRSVYQSAIQGSKHSRKQREDIVTLLTDIFEQS